MTITHNPGGTEFTIGKDFVDCAVGVPTHRGSIEYVVNGRTLFKRWVSTVDVETVRALFKREARRLGIAITKLDGAKV